MFRLFGVVAVLALCGCYKDPAFRDCAIACTSDCPGDLSCDPQQHMCRLPGMTGACQGSGGVDAALDPMADADGDGVKNGVDNCPLVGNPLQEDEDTDMIGDACDPCPISTNNIDSDADGVGDDCDPNPMPSGGHVIMDHIVLFDGFAHSLDASYLMAGTGGVSTTLGQVQIDASSGHVESFYFPLTESAGGETITTALSYGAALGSGEGAGPMLLIDPATGNGVACVLFDSGGNHGELDIEETSNSSFDASAPISDPPEQGVHTLRIRRIPNASANNTVKCADGASSTSATPSNRTTEDGGLFVEGTIATFDYVMVVASGT